MSSYSIHGNSNEVSVEFSKPLEKMFDREARSLQHGAREAVCTKYSRSAAIASGPKHKSLCLFIRQSTGKGESARPETISFRTANRDVYADASSSLAR